MKLGTLLLRDAIITLTQLEAGLRSQVLYGGRLGSNLVELEALDVDTLSLYLGKMHNVNVASQARLEAVDGEILEIFGADNAELFSAYPLGYEGGETGNKSKLGVALSDPGNRAAIEQLETQLGMPVAPYALAEMRLYYYLEKSYGLTRQARYVRTGDASSTPQGERRLMQPADGIVDVPEVRLEPKSSASRSGKPKPGKPKPGKPKPDKRGKQGKPERPVQIKVSFADTQEVIDRAERRNEIFDALMAYAIGRFDALAVFLIRDRNALGWRMYSAHTPKTKAIQQVALPLGGASVLEMALDTKEVYRGQSPAQGMPVEKRLWEALGNKQPPNDMIVVPVVVNDRIVNLVYGHHLEVIDDTHAEELTLILAKVADAYLRLIRNAKEE